MAIHDGFDSVRFQVRTGKGSPVEEHFSDVSREGVPVPNAIMTQLVPAKEKAFQSQRRKKVVNP